MKLFKESIQEIKTLLDKPANIVITTHVNPDGDAMGSSLGLYNYLKTYGHNITVIAPNDYPDNLKWLRGSSKVLLFDTNVQKADAALAAAEIIFCLDFNSLTRIDELGKKIGESKAVKFMVDHHPNPDQFADYVLSEVTASSTCELIYDLIDMLGDADSITKSIGEALFCGIMTDTGSFRFTSATAKTFEIAAALIKSGVDQSTIHENVMENFSESRLRLLGFAINEKLKVIEELSTVFITLSAEELKRYNYKDGDTEGFVNYGLSIEGIKFAVIFKESDENIRMSFRSKGDFPANEFAKAHFNGGGHKNAAGGRTEGSLDDAILHFLRVLPNYREQLKKERETEKNEA